MKQPREAIWRYAPIHIFKQSPETENEANEIMMRRKIPMKGVIERWLS